MTGFCGALNFKERRVHFSTLKRMCGLCGSGCAYINGEFGILCDIPISESGEIFQPVTVSYNNALYTCAVSGEAVARDVLERYIEEGDGFIHNLCANASVALYDSRCGELMLAQLGNARAMYYTQQDGVLYFSSALRPLFRLFGGCIRISRSALLRRLVDRESDFDGLLCDIVRIGEGQMLLASSLGESLIPFCAPMPDLKVGMCEEKIKIGEIRCFLSERLFEYDYPRLDVECFEAMSKREQKKAERAMDKILADYLEKPHCVLSALGAREISEETEKQKSIPLRLYTKGMLCETAMWFETFNLVIA